MQIRREQALLIATVLVGVWIWSGTEPPVPAPRLTPKWRQHTPEPMPALPIVDEAGLDPRLGRDPFLEPSESSPLPPVRLDMPPLATLPVVAPPLVPGQYPAAYAQLRVDGGVVEQRLPPKAAGEDGEGAGTDGAGGAAPANAGLRAQDPPPQVGNGHGAGGGGREQYERTWDRVVVRSGQDYWGEILGDPDVKYSLPGKRVFTEPVRMRWVSERTGNVTRADQKIQPEDIVSVHLAKTTRNWVELKSRQIPRDPNALPDRYAFLEELLAAARDEAWLYGVAQQQADIVIALLGKDDEEGWRWKARVLWEAGDLEGVLDLCKQLPESLAGKSFQLRTLGEVAAKLTLWREAEQQLRAAVERDGANPRCRAALAEFLLQRGRAREALEHALQAQRLRGAFAGLGDAERADITALLISVHLALGQHKEAFDLLGALPPEAKDRPYLQGAIAYAAGNAADAANRFKQATTSGSTPEAVLGLGVCQLWNKEWDEATSNLRAVADRSPLLRHRALAALALLFERTGNVAEALVEAQAAQAAAPHDPYVLYLLGRELRQSGQLEAAHEVLREALQQHFDLTDLLAEMAMNELTRATRGGDTDAEALARAVRYADQLVARDEARTPVYVDLQGLVHYVATDLRGAHEAWSVAQAKSDSLFAAVGLALCAYGQNRVTEAFEQLTAVREKLPRDHALQPWLVATLHRIEENAGKEQLRDAFDRAELGQAWTVTLNGEVQPHLQDEAVVIRGKPDEHKPVAVSRVLEARRVVAVECDLTVGPQHSRDAFAGLQLAPPSTQTGARNDFTVQLGVVDGEAKIKVQDGQKPDEVKWKTLAGASAAPGTPHRLELRLVPRDASAGATSAALALQAFWDGVLVHEQEVNRVTGNTRTPLAIDLRVDCRRSAPVHVTFDSFRMVRKKEK